MMHFIIRDVTEEILWKPIGAHKQSIIEEHVIIQITDTVVYDS